MTARTHELTLLQMNDTHAYFAPHQEVFWTAGGATYRPAGGYARIATLARQIRDERPGRVLFSDGGEDDERHHVPEVIGILALAAREARGEIGPREHAEHDQDAIPAHGEPPERERDRIGDHQYAFPQSPRRLVISADLLYCYNIFSPLGA